MKKLLSALSIMLLLSSQIKAAKYNQLNQNQFLTFIFLTIDQGMPAEMCNMIILSMLSPVQFSGPNLINHAAGFKIIRKLLLSTKRKNSDQLYLQAYDNFFPKTQESLTTILKQRIKSRNNYKLLLDRDEFKKCLTLIFGHLFEFFGHKESETHQGKIFLPILASWGVDVKNLAQRPFNPSYDTKSYIETSIFNDNEEALEMLLLLGADPNALNSKKLPHIFSASWAGANKEKILQTLINYGAQVNHCDEKVGTPLHRALWSLTKDYSLFDEKNENPDKLKAIQLLLDAKANPHVIHPEKGTPLHTAIQVCVCSETYAPEIISVLLDAKADLNIKVRNFPTPAQIIKTFKVNPTLSEDEK